MKVDGFSEAEAGALRELETKVVSDGMKNPPTTFGFSAFEWLSLQVGIEKQNIEENQ